MFEAFQKLETLKRVAIEYHDKITREFYKKHTHDYKTFVKLHTQLWVDFEKAKRRITRGKLGAIKDKIMGR